MKNFKQKIEKNVTARFMLKIITIIRYCVFQNHIGSCFKFRLETSACKNRTVDNIVIIPLNGQCYKCFCLRTQKYSAEKINSRKKENTYHSVSNFMRN